jgi:hypothetical protein
MLPMSHDHQWSTRKKAKDAITLRLPFSYIDIIGRMETDPLSVSDVGSTLRNWDSREGGGLPRSISINGLMETVTMDDNGGCSKSPTGGCLCIQLEDVIL